MENLIEIHRKQSANVGYLDRRRSLTKQKEILFYIAFETPTD